MLFPLLRVGEALLRPKSQPSVNEYVNTQSINEAAFLSPKISMLRFKG